jgi:hypothetical protein
LPAETARGQEVPRVTEHQLMGEFVERFTRFIDWPAGVLPEGEGRLQVCVLGSSVVGDEILRMARIRSFKGRAAQTRRLSISDHPGGCHLLFIGWKESSRLQELLPLVANRPVLTVSDAPGFGEQGVLINFYREATRVRFEINLLAVQHSGLTFRAQLLRLGRLVGQPRK